MRILEKLLSRGMSDLKILGIDTSGQTASVAVCTKDNILAQTTIFTKLTHSQVILPIANQVLEQSSTSLSEIDGIAITSGPGSYTGLRIGIAAVKAMCFSLEKKCIGISTLESLAWNMVGFKGIICSVMTARSNLLYTALFEGDGKSIIRLTDDEILPISDIVLHLTRLDGEIFFVGDGTSSLLDLDELNTSSRYTFAHVNKRLQLASSSCYAAFAKGLENFYDPELLQAQYLQITKAEKDLTNS